MVVIALAVLAGDTQRASADVSCATFFWTGSSNAAVARYQPRYLVGDGLEDVGMGNIVGTRIRYQWSTQAARCFAQAGANGYFAHPDFRTAACSAAEACAPGTRARRLSERLTDVQGVAAVLATPNADATYQASLSSARASSFAVIDAMANTVRATTGFYDQLATSYGPLIDQLARVVDAALPAALRTALLGQLCAAGNVGHLRDLGRLCSAADGYCELPSLAATIDSCAAYQAGQTLAQLTGPLTTARTGLVQERAQITSQRDAIQLRWSQIQALHP